MQNNTLVAEMKAARKLLARHIAKGTRGALKTQYAGRLEGSSCKETVILLEFSPEARQPLMSCLSPVRHALTCLQVEP